MSYSPMVAARSWSPSASTLGLISMLRLPPSTGSALATADTSPPQAEQNSDPRANGWLHAGHAIIVGVMAPTFAANALASQPQHLHRRLAYGGETVAQRPVVPGAPAVFGAACGDAASDAREAAGVQ